MDSRYNFLALPTGLARDLGLRGRDGGPADLHREMRAFRCPVCRWLLHGYQLYLGLYIIYSLCIQIPTEAGEENQSAAYWTDPATGVTHALDPRTGNSYATNKTRGDEPEGRRTLSRHAQKPDLDEIPDWIQQALGVGVH